MSLQNFQNLHSTSWFRVANGDFCFYHLLNGVQELCLISLRADSLWEDSFQRFEGNLSFCISCSDCV